MNKTKNPELPSNLPPNVKIVTLDELKMLAKRLKKVTDFNFTGAILCMIAGLYFAQNGKQILPIVFIILVVLTSLMTVLSYRASNRVSKVLEIIGKKNQK